MHSEWHTALINQGSKSLDKVVTSLSMVPNCHYYHCKHNLNRCNTLQSSCSDPNIQQTGLAQKEMAVIVLIRLERDFRRVFPKRIGDIVNFCRNNQAIKVFTTKRRYLYVFFKENVFEACLLSCWGTYQTFTVVIYNDKCAILNFQTLFFKSFGIFIVFVKFNWKLICWLKTCWS